MKRLTLLFVLSLAFVNPYLRGDGNGYYAWLRSPLIDGDTHFGNEYQHADAAFREAFVQPDGSPTPVMRTPTGKVENQWSIGPALAWLPAFAVAHAVALAGGGSADGYGPLYLWLAAASTAVYGFLAIVIGADLARRFGQARWATLAATGVWLATSLPVYMYVLPFHVHAIAAFSTGLFFWWGFTRVESWQPRAWLVWGAIAGLMLVVYYVHAVFLVFVAWRLAQPGPLRDRLRALAACAAGMLPFAVLFALSRYAVYGSLFTTGYRDGFFWFSPRLLATAFSAEHGLFTWTPLVAIALAGLIALARRDPRARIILIAWAVLFYVIASYQNWHGQSSFGNRFFVSLSALLVPGVAAALAWLHGRARVLPALTIAILVIWNAGFVFQWGLNIVPSRGPVNFAVVARNQATVVPARLASTVMRYFRDRGGFTSAVEAEDAREREQYRLRR